MKGNLADDFEDNEELVAKSEIVEKFIKVVENSENNYLGTNESQSKEARNSQRSNPFGKSQSPNLNSREEIRKKLAFGGFSGDSNNSGENSSKKPGK